MTFSQAAAAAPSGLLLAPADGGPLGLLLGLLDQGEEPHAAVVQVLVHQDAVKQVSVLDLQQPGRVLQLQEVVLLQAEKMQLTNVETWSLSKLVCGTKGFRVRVGVRGQRSGLGPSTVKALLAPWALMIRASLLVSRSLSGLGGLMKITNGFSLGDRSIWTF